MRKRLRIALFAGHDRRVDHPLPRLLECLLHHTVAAMRPQDIAIKLTDCRGRAPDPDEAHVCLAAARVVSRAVVAPFEGLSARIGVYQGATLIEAREVLVFIVFGRAVPTDRQLQRVNAELRRARFGRVKATRPRASAGTA